ncbi:hypothetical protein, partial [Paracoccus chinensis]
RGALEAQAVVVELSNSLHHKKTFLLHRLCFVSAFLPDREAKAATQVTEGPVATVDKAVKKACHIAEVMVATVNPERLAIQDRLVQQALRVNLATTS